MSNCSIKIPSSASSSLEAKNNLMQIFQKIAILKVGNVFGCKQLMKDPEGEGFLNFWKAKTHLSDFQSSSKDKLNLNGDLVLFMGLDESTEMIQTGPWVFVVLFRFLSEAEFLLFVVETLDWLAQSPQLDEESLGYLEQRRWLDQSLTWSSCFGENSHVHSYTCGKPSQKSHTCWTKDWHHITSNPSRLLCFWV